MQMREEEMTPYRATGLAEGFIDGTNEEIIAAWQYLHDTRIAYQLQGFFGRTAANLLEGGVITDNEDA